MDLSYTFNEDVNNYDRWRPTYCKELFDDINRHSQLDKNKKGLEIGIGTGQATKPFLDTGCYITAVDPGSNLVNFSKNKFKDYKNFHIKQVCFEDFVASDDVYDIIYSATAFHWIPEKIGYPKAYDLLKEGGTLALFWNKPSIEDKLLNLKLQSIYKKYKPSQKSQDDKSRQRKIIASIRNAGFRDLKLHIYHQTRVFNSLSYISLLETYSDHRSMNPQSKKLLYSEIQEIIFNNGDTLNIHDTIKLYLARK